jgi:hypothetical protein
MFHPDDATVGLEDYLAITREDGGVNSGDSGTRLGEQASQETIEFSPEELRIMRMRDEIGQLGIDVAGLDRHIADFVGKASASAVRELREQYAALQLSTSPEVAAKMRDLEYRSRLLAFELVTACYAGFRDDGALTGSKRPLAARMHYERINGVGELGKIVSAIAKDEHMLPFWQKSEPLAEGLMRGWNEGGGMPLSTKRRLQHLTPGNEVADREGRAIPALIEEVVAGIAHQWAQIHRDPPPSSIEAFKLVRIVEHSPENVRRLTECYSAVMAEDEELLRLICDKSGTSRKDTKPINRMTEQITAKDIQVYLTMPHTVTMELPNRINPDGPPSGFLSVRHAGYTRSDHAQFRDYMLDEQCPSVEFRPDMKPERRRFLEGLDNGDLFYVVEFASKDSVHGAAALIQTLLLEVMAEVQHRRGRPFSGVVARCLESARLGDDEELLNARGNANIRELNANLDMKTIGLLRQPKERLLRVPLGVLRDLVPLSRWADIGIVNQGHEAIVPARLNFALHYGSYQGMLKKLNALPTFRSLGSYVEARGRTRIPVQ